MQNVLIQTVVYVTLLGLGFGFKKAGIFRVEDSAFLKSAILYLTMPATAVNGMKALELQPSFLWCLLIGFVTCTVLTVVGLFTARHSSPSRRLLYLFSLNSFNVGNFAIPFLTGCSRTTALRRCACSTSRWPSTSTASATRWPAPSPGRTAGSRWGGW